MWRTSAKVPRTKANEHIFRLVLWSDLQSRATYPRPTPTNRINKAVDNEAIKRPTTGARRRIESRFRRRYGLYRELTCKTGTRDGLASPRLHKAEGRARPHRREHGSARLRDGLEVQSGPLVATWNPVEHAGARHWWVEPRRSTDKPLLGALVIRS